MIEAQTITFATSGGKSPVTSPFETRTCPRCGGTGRYSFNHMYGDTCFGCSGRGVQFTKRGQMAREYFNALCSVPASDLAIGAVIWHPGSTFSQAGWITITEIKPGLDDEIEIIASAESKSFKRSVKPEKMIRVAQDAETKTAAFQQALAYQAGLTKAGTVRKQTGSK